MLAPGPYLWLIDLMCYIGEKTSGEAPLRYAVGQHQPQSLIARLFASPSGATSCKRPLKGSTIIADQYTRHAFDWRSIGAVDYAIGFLLGQAA